METSFLFVFVVIPKNPIVHEGFINNFLSIPYTKAKIPGQSKYQDFVLGLKKIVFFHDDSWEVWYIGKGTLKQRRKALFL